MKEHRILVLGGRGMVGSRFVEIYQDDPHFVLDTPSKDELDVTDEDALSRRIDTFEPSIILNYVAYIDVKKAQAGQDEGLAHRLNVALPRSLGRLSLARDIKVMQVLTEYIYDGQKEADPYSETDEANPINTYGQTKFEGYQELLDSGCKLLTAAISMPYSARYNCPPRVDITSRFLQMMNKDQSISAIKDNKITPQETTMTANAFATLIKSDQYGSWNIGPTNAMSAYEFVCLIANTFPEVGYDKSKIQQTSFDAFVSQPGINASVYLRNSALDSSKFNKAFPGVLKSIEQNIQEYKQILTSSK